MDKIIAARLDKDSEHYDAQLYARLSKTANDYVQNGLNALNYYVPDLDAANDLVQMYSPVPMRDFEKADRNAGKFFIHPMTATEVTTLATFTSQILFGTQSSRRVEARQDGDEDAADAVNDLLQWNDDQQPTYVQGYSFCWDAITFNRGVFYERWQPTYKIDVEPVTEWDITAEQVPVMRKDGTGPRMRAGEPVMEYPQITRWRKKRTETGGHVHLDCVSPYDFVCDPQLPILRMQEGRFAAHRVMIPWHELKKRSELPPEHPNYVLPDTVARLKKRKQTDMQSIMHNVGRTESVSRSFYERNRRGLPQGGLGALGAANKEDGGVVECWAVIIRQSPQAIGLYDDDTEQELIEILEAGPTELLSVQVLPNKHDGFPYAVGEARPNVHQQFTKGWALVIKPIQDHVDYLNSRHRESLARTSGNIFLFNPDLIDFEAFTDPCKDGLAIPMTEKGIASGMALDQMIKQIPINDTTERFNEEMQMWIEQAETATGAHAYVQGETDDPEQTATQFAGTQQMATGRISSIARILSVSALVPQTRRMVSDLQQFMPEQMVVKITGDDEFDPDVPQTNFRTIQRADIQAELDIVPHDGSLPGADAKVVAAASRALEIGASNPLLAQAFDNTTPGALDPVAIYKELLKKAGLPVKKFQVTREQAIQNLQQKQMAAGVMPPQMTGADPNAAPPVEGMPPGTPMASASRLPPTPTAAPPPPGPAQV